MSQIYQETPKSRSIPFIFLKTNILENFDFVFLEEDIQRLISSAELFPSNVRGLRYTDLKKVNFSLGNLVGS